MQSSLEQQPSYSRLGSSLLLLEKKSKARFYQWQIRFRLLRHTSRVHLYRRLVLLSPTCVASFILRVGLRAPAVASPSRFTTILYPSHSSSSSCPLQVLYFLFHYRPTGTRHRHNTPNDTTRHDTTRLVVQSIPCCAVSLSVRVGKCLDTLCSCNSLPPVKNCILHTNPSQGN